MRTFFILLAEGEILCKKITLKPDSLNLYSGRYIHDKGSMSKLLFEINEKEKIDIVY